MKNILVPVEQHTLLPQVLETSLLLGQQFESYVEGLPITFAVPATMAPDVAIPPASLIDPVSRHETTVACRHHFESFMEGRSVPRSTRETTGLSFGWYRDELKDDTFVGDYARSFDITVVGQPGTKQNRPRAATVETVLFESGRPAFIVPPTPPATLGRSILIAWNRSTETSRTVALGMPLLLRAERVIVLEVAGWGKGDATGADLVRSLRRQGVPAEAQTVKDTGGAGRTVLTTAAATDCDLLFKGAYTVSRFRQMIFGGPTTHILARSELPVFMAH
jgi:nucleotide-binding universal stress UspA family protein